MVRRRSITTSTQATTGLAHARHQFEKMVIGWREWGMLPELGIPIIKVKMDSGAKTSALHAFECESYLKRGKHWVSFSIHPLQHNSLITRRCHAPVIDERIIRSSSGHEEERYVIETPIQIGDLQWPIHITLTNRDLMSYRFLLGREAMHNLILDPSRSFVQGKLSTSKALKAYLTMEP